ncbi:MAG: YfhO family protein [Lachnospiraceae bacterium]|nr:YfhO family protein [Lachnospiraceae bacterium]
MKQKFSLQKLLPYLVAFLIPVAIMLILFIQRQIYPFGDRSFLRTDLYHQYAPFHQMLRDALQTGKNLQYTWNVGLGTNMVSLFAYYLCSPCNLLLLFCPSNLVIEFISYFAIVKIGLASTAMTFYLAKHSRSTPWTSVFFGILYALSGYVAAYSWNVMWLDCIWLFPLVIYAMERLIKTGKGGLYALLLGVAICTNYYIAIMICMFLILYFIVQIIISSDSFLVRTEDGTGNGSKTFGRYILRMVQFAVYSLLAGGISAILLLPAYYALKLTASASTTFPKNLDSYFSTFEVIARHLICVETEQGLDHWPNIFCGIAPLVLLPLYVMSKKISAREKICYFVLVLFFLFTFSLKVLNYIWHGFHFPNSLPARHSFLYIFLLLTMAYNGFLELRERNGKEIIGSMWGVIAITLVAETIITDDAFQWWSFLLSILFAAVYGGLCYLYQRQKTTRSFLYILTMCVLVIEMTINTGDTSITTSSRTTYTGEDISVKSLLADAKTDEDSVFYRVEKVSTRTKNDGAWLGYQSGSIFSSAANAKLTAFYKTLGMEGSTNAYSMHGATPLTLALFDVKYMLAKETLHEDALRSLFARASNMYLYRNNYALNLGFMVPSSLEWSWSTTNSNPILNQNAFASAVADIKDLFYPTTYTLSTVTSTNITVDADGYVYGYVEPNSNVKTVTARYADNTTEEFSNVNRGYILDLGYHTAGETIYLYTDDSGSMTAYGYLLDMDKMVELLQTLRQEQMIVDSYDNTHLSAHITTENGGRLLTSIPYDPGFTVTVDGKTAELLTFKDAFLSLELTPGTHTIEFTYQAEGLQLGGMISLVSLVLLALIILIGRGLIPLLSRHKKKATKEEESTESEMKPDSNPNRDPENADSQKKSEPATKQKPDTQEAAASYQRYKKSKK